MLDVQLFYEFMQQSTPVPKPPFSHPAPFRTFERRTDDVPKARHVLASTTANCGSAPKVFEIRYSRVYVKVD